MNKEKLVPKLRFEKFKQSETWKVIRLGENATFINGRAYSQEELLDNGKYKVLRVGNFYTNDSWYYSNFELNNKYYAEYGDLLYTWSASFGPHIWKGEKVIYHYHIWKIELNKKLDKIFLLQLLEEDKKQILSNVTGSTMVHITKSGMEEKNVIIPENIYEQQKIGIFFKKIDEMIQLQQSKVNKVKDIKSAYLSEMFPKEGEKYPKKRFEGFTEPWKLTKFMEIAEVERGLTYHPTDIVEKGGVRVLRSSNIYEDTFITKDDDVFVNENAINIEFSNEKNILITSANGSSRLVGKHAILEQLDTPSVHGGFMLLVRTARPYFLNASMSSDWYRKFIRYNVAGGGGSIGNIKKSDLEHQLIYIPSKEEQEKIGQFFKNLDNQISIEEEKLRKLRKLKQAYLNDMFV